MTGEVKIHLGGASLWTRLKVAYSLVRYRGVILTGINATLEKK